MPRGFDFRFSTWISFLQAPDYIVSNDYIVSKIFENSRRYSPVSMTPKLVEKFAAGIFDTCGKFAAGVVDIGGNFDAGVFCNGGKFATGVVDTGVAH